MAARVSLESSRQMRPEVGVTSVRMDNWKNGSYWLSCCFAWSKYDFTPSSRLIWPKAIFSKI